MPVALVTTQTALIQNLQALSALGESRAPGPGLGDLLAIHSRRIGGKSAHTSTSLFEHLFCRTLFFVRAALTRTPTRRGGRSTSALPL